MSSYEIVYFPIAGRAYVTRCMLSIADVPYKNVFPSWPADKPKMPFGRLPVLKELKADGSTFELAESTVIERYVAHKYGFLPKDLEGSATVEQYVAQICDTIDTFIDHAFVTKTEESKKKLLQTLTFLIEKHEQILSKSTSGYYYGDSLTLADLYMFTVFGMILKNEDKDLDIFSKSQAQSILKLVELVKQNKGVASVRNDKE